MTWDYVREQLHEPGVVIGGLLLSLTLLSWLGYRVHRFVKSDRPDDALSNVAMLIGLGWSSEAVWELTARIPHFPAHLRFLIFFVLEVLLVLAMIRAKRSMTEHQHPGRSGRTAWIVAVVMAAVAGAVAQSLPEALLRIAIPLLVTKQWWDGLVGEGARQRKDATSWRWTPRRLLLALGAIEPGERDVESVNRERVTQVMTRLEHRRRNGSKLFSGRRAARLARLSLTADDDIIGEVRRRVDRAMWFKPDPSHAAPGASPRSVSVGDAASRRAARVRHGRTIRALRVTNPRPVIVAAQAPRQDQRETQDIDFVVRVVKDARPELPNTRIAQLVASSEPTVRRALRRTQNGRATKAAKVNGSVPDLEGASS